MQNSNSTVSSSVELDLFEVFGAIWKRKWLVVGTTLGCGLIAAAYVFFTTPVYESKYYISPPTVNDISNLNIGRSDRTELKPILVEQVYKIFLRNLQSESLRRAFFESTYLPAMAGDGSSVSNSVLYSAFSKSVTVAPVGKEEDGRWSVSLQDSDPERSVAWVASYVSQVGETTARELAQDAKKVALVLARNRALEIDTLRESSSKIRQDNITKIREALLIAQSSGLENAVVFSGKGSEKLVGNMFEGNAYMRGSKALEAELKNLENRVSEDPFTPGLRQLQKEFEFYKMLGSETFKIAAFRHDGVLDLPVSPVKPKKALIVFLGLLVGGFLGSAIALLSHFIAKRREAEATAAK
ncbi:Wzz/FepE/Etk N-terminal domain-containing protein [Pseudomonas sp. NIBR-H-19]|uniref:LPS O-antigen chain length determinant protein WzzB n=1 Tax=Pseudomonas sp. NIBR-H-19 TaxID=2901380 RepID=UPI001E434320|nr:Wzz/FepE/Etk N-terminal domain-containing protein [Pseudomonas sp. NIBR-H-19]UHC82566.1 Wzz/FepE/Etk N-terminal domain-containing protein [Pseudomonas sp. NIBR-H-19]